MIELSRYRTYCRITHAHPRQIRRACGYGDHSSKAYWRPQAASSVVGNFGLLIAFNGFINVFLSVLQHEDFWVLDHRLILNMVVTAHHWLDTDTQIRSGYYGPFMVIGS